MSRQYLLFPLMIVSVMCGGCAPRVSETFRQTAQPVLQNLRDIDAAVRARNADEQMRLAYALEASWRQLKDVWPQNSYQWEKRTLETCVVKEKLLGRIVSGENYSTMQDDMKDWLFYATNEAEIVEAINHAAHQDADWPLTLENAIFHGSDVGSSTAENALLAVLEGKSEHP